MLYWGRQILTALERRGEGRRPSIRVCVSLACPWRHRQRQREGYGSLSACMSVQLLIFRWVLRLTQWRHMKLKSLGIPKPGRGWPGRKKSSLQGIYFRGTRRAVTVGRRSSEPQGPWCFSHPGLKQPTDLGFLFPGNYTGFDVELEGAVLRDKITLWSVGWLRILEPGDLEQVV